MKAVKRTPDGRLVVFHEGERAVVVQLVGGLIELVAELLPDDDDEFAGIVGESPSPSVIAERDPALRRLFPPAYADEAADAEYRRFTEPDAARAKVEAALVVWNALRESDRVVIPDADFDAWIKTITNLRLALFERDDSELEDILDWLGWALESLLDA